jgi:taurine dioxygenase
MTTISIAPLSPVIGAEISGIDVSHDLTQEDAGKMRQALLDYGVIFIRGQELSPDQLMTFAHAFGEPVEYPFVQGLKDHPLIIPVLKRADEDKNFGGIWHSDTSYLAEPPMGTILHAQELPDVGGDTLFANMYAAYETLSEGMKEMLGPLRAINSGAKKAAAVTREDRIVESGKDASAVQTDAIHPVIRTHPETGRKALYVNVAHTVRFDGMTEEESAPLLEYLFDHQIREEFICRFRWSPGAIAFWDNRCIQHYPVNDYHGQQRLLHRITLKGDVPR